MVHKIYSHGAVELIGEGGAIFKVNGQRVKLYYDGNAPDKEVFAAWYLAPSI